jgi:hypothetical protein
MSNHQCQSCAMPVETGPYCQYCADSQGNLQSFETRLDAMTSFFMGQDPSLDRVEAEKRTRAYMARMPAWKDHPALKNA